MKSSKQKSLSLSEFPRVVEGLTRTKVDSKTAQAGRSMIEMLGVLAIIGVLTVGGIAGYSKAMKKYETNQTINQMQQIINNAKITFANQTSYRGIYKAAELGILPDNVIARYSDLYDNYETTLLQFPYHQDYYHNTLTVSEHFSPQAVILQIGTDKDTCTALASHDWKTALGNDLVAIGIGHGDISDIIANNYMPISAVDYTEDYYGNTALIPTSTLPLSMDTIARFCAQREGQRTPGFGIVFK